MSKSDTREYDPFDPANPDWGQPPNVPRPTSGLAIASLVCGIVFCVPMITSALAVVFGFAGLRRTRDPYVGGRGMAISGLILGLVGIGFWLFVGAGGYLLLHQVYAEQRQAERTASRFAQDLSEGKIDAALAATTPGFERARLEAAAIAMQQGGPFNELSCQVLPLFSDGQTMRWVVEGDVVFSRGRKRVSLGLIKEAGRYKVERFEIK